MNCDERDIIKDIVDRRGLPEKRSVFRRVSPSNKHVILGGAALVSIALIAIYIISKPHMVRNQRGDSSSYINSRLMPKDEVTPEYIDSMANRESNNFSKDDKKKEEKPNDKNENTAEQNSPQVSSMMIYSKDSFSNQLGSLGVPLGTELSAVLEKTVIADDRSMPVIARITKDYEENGRNIIPRNSRILGSTQGMVEDRVQVKFTKIVFPDGKEHPFSGVALDSKGVGGIPGDLKKKRGQRGRGIISSALIGASGVFDPSGSGFVDTAVRGAHRGASGELMRDSRYYSRTEATPVVTIRAKTYLTVFVDKAV